MKLGAVALFIVLAGLSEVANAETIFASTCQDLLRFDSATPGSIESVVPIVGMDQNGNECIDSLEFDPGTGVLYALAHRTDQFTGLCLGLSLYVVDPNTGQAVIGWVAPDSIDFCSVGDSDVFPETGQLRMLDGTGLNFRLEPTTEQLSMDSPLAPYRQVLAVAHHPNALGILGIETYSIAAMTPEDAPTELVRLGGPEGQPPASSGELTVIGPLGVELTFVGGFDVSPSGVAYISGIVDPAESAIEGGGEGLTSHLFSIDLATGAATDLGEIPAQQAAPPYVRALAVEVLGQPGVLAVPALDQRFLALLTGLLAVTGVAILATKRRA